MDALKNLRLDGAQSLFLEKELEHVQSELYQVKYPNLLARSFLPPSRSPASAGSRSFTTRIMDMVGKAALVANWGDDPPRADVFKDEQNNPIRALASSYGFNHMELIAAAEKGISLDVAKGMAARKAIDTSLDDLLSTGDTASGLTGFINHPDANDALVANNAGATSRLWVNKTPDEVLKDLSEPGELIADQTKGIFGVTGLAMLMPIAKYNYIANRRVTDGSESILSYFLRNNQQVASVAPWHKLKGAGEGATDRMVVYQPDPEVLFYEVPMEFNQLPVQSRGLEYIVPCLAACGGVILQHPGAVEFRDGF
jgi:hypothetical protein